MSEISHVQCYNNGQNFRVILQNWFFLKMKRKVCPFVWRQQKVICTKNCRFLLAGFKDRSSRTQNFAATVCKTSTSPQNWCSLKMILKNDRWFILWGKVSERSTLILIDRTLIPDLPTHMPIPHRYLHYWSEHGSPRPELSWLSRSITKW